ncbi:hypothetical protein [Achromobacter xylosoxidans]|uniref:hypothetical protein n=1 Tax=Alcaligenes xylosoxydans xylosoxydans TaxID=85698 RepID=UPI000B21EAA9|nr:hypothetical protein [Achromobacter xylosoxidans]
MNASPNLTDPYDPMAGTMQGTGRITYSPDFQSEKPATARVMQANSPATPHETLIRAPGGGDRSTLQCQARGCDGCLICRPAGAAQVVQERHKTAGGAGAAPDSFARAPVVAKPADRGILALDPGTDKTGWCLLLGDRVIGSGVEPNDQMLAKVLARGATTLAVEMIASYGMPVGREVFETCVWIGRFVQAWGGAVEMVYRKDVKMHLCGTAKAKDGNVRQAILDLYPRTGGGATPQVGTKGRPGPLYGVSTHAWAALGVAITARHRLAQERKA